MKGKVRSVQEIQKARVSDLKGRIEALEAKLPKLPPGSNKRHQKARRMGILQQRLVALKDDRRAGRVRLCFGSRKRFRAQFDLAANGYADHASAWLQDGRPPGRARCSSWVPRMRPQGAKVASWSPWGTDASA